MTSSTHGKQSLPPPALASTCYVHMARREADLTDCWRDIWDQGLIHPVHILLYILCPKRQLSLWEEAKNALSLLKSSDLHDLGLMPPPRRSRTEPVLKEQEDDTPIREIGVKSSRRLPPAVGVLCGDNSNLVAMSFKILHWKVFLAVLVAILWANLLMRKVPGCHCTFQNSACSRMATTPR